MLTVSYRMRYDVTGNKSTPIALTSRARNYHTATVFFTPLAIQCLKTDTPSGHTPSGHTPFILTIACLFFYFFKGLVPYFLGRHSFVSHRYRLISCDTITRRVGSNILH